jgi:hypothetical protein
MGTNMRYDADGLSHNAARSESGSNQPASDMAMVVPVNAMAQLARRLASSSIEAAIGMAW